MKIKYYLTSSGLPTLKNFRISNLLRSDRTTLRWKILTTPTNGNLSNIYRGLHELRLKDAAGITRVFYFIKKRTAIQMIHVFKKKSQELPKKEVKLTIKRIKEA